MFYKIIENYIKNMTKENIVSFSLKNNIYLNNQEIDYIYKTIREKYNLLLSDDFKIVFDDAQNYISSNNLKKIYNLFIDYRNKYFFN